MNPRPTRSAMKRTVTWTAASALAVGGLMAGAATASADATVDLRGVVTNAAGAPLPNISVSAYGVLANGDVDFTVGDFTQTDASGNYAFTNLETEGTQFKISFVDGTDYGTNPRALPYRSGYLGGFQNPRASATVTAAPNSGAVAPAESLAQGAGLAVTVLNPAGAPVADGSVSSLLPQGNLGYENPFTNFSSTSADDFSYDNPATPATEPAPLDGVVFFDDLKGGQTVKLLGSGSDTDALGDDVSYLSQFFGGGFSYEKATEVTPIAGQVQALTIQLTSAFTAVDAPRIIGNASFGSTLKADPGTWPVNGFTEYNYTWLRGSTPVGTGATYQVTKADKKKKIRLQVIAVNGDFVGQAVTKRTAKVGEKTKVSVKKGKNGSYNVAVKVAKKKKAKKLGTPQGKVVLVVDETGKVASKKVKLRGGKATLTVRAKFAGEDLSVAYLGAKKLGPDTAAIKSKGGKKGKGDKKDKKN